MKLKARVFPLLVVAGVLAGCGGGSELGVSPADVDQQDIPAVLAADDADELIRNSLTAFYTSPDSGNRGGGGDVLAVESSADGASADAGGSGGGGQSRFSDTNVQEEGVDESDRIKIDGDVLFALEQPDPGYQGFDGAVPDIIAIDSAGDSLPYYEPQTDTLSAYRLNGDNSSVLSRLALEELTGRSTSGMYLYKGGNNTDLVLLSGGSFNPWDIWPSSYAFAGLETRLSWVDARNPENMSVRRTMDIQGHLVSSRRIDNRLILVTRFHPNIDGIVPYAYTDSDIQNNRNAIANADISDLTPMLTITEDGDSSQRPVIDNNLCYANRPVPSQDDSENGIDGDSSENSTDEISPVYPSPSIVTIISVDLASLATNTTSTCFVGDSETLYVSTEAVYLATTTYDYTISNDDGVEIVDGGATVRPIQYYQPDITTEIHKFSFNGAGAPIFKGTGSVKGHLGWNPDRKPFRMSEKDNRLRIVTFDESRPRSPVTFNILQEASGRLAAISTLPNDTRPEPIGKPGENLYASRFIGDRAYLVTFRVTDPLYVLDLSNPIDPRIAGELEIPGYSDYLHPVNDSLLIGLGKDAIPDNSGFGDGLGRGAWYQGVKLALYDVADPTNPFVADERTIGKRGTDSPALQQHHSFAYLASAGDSNAQFAIPMSVHNEPTTGQPQSWSQWTSNNMLNMEVDESSNRFVDVPDWQFESRADGFGYNPVSLYNDRAVIGADGGLYVIHNGTLHFGQWGNNEPTASFSQ